jgi:hypothetical protein
MKISRSALVASAAVTSIGLVMFGAAAAGGAPSNAPSVRTGNLYCGPGLDYPIITNSGDSQVAVTWSAIRVTFLAPNGTVTGTGILVPTSYNVTITSGGQSSTVDATKGNAASGTASCVIGESGSGFSLSGVVTGTFVVNG